MSNHAESTNAVPEENPTVVFQDDSYKQDSEFDELFENAVEQGAEPVSMDDLMKGVKTAEQVIKNTDAGQQPVKWSEDDGTNNDDLDKMIHEVSPTTPKLPPHMVHSPHSKDRKQSSTKPVVQSSDYQESFASQRETSEMRSELEGMSARLSNLEQVLETILAERSTLPKHISTIREDLNSQLTLMMDKLNSSIEAGVTSAAAQDASQAVVSASDEIGDQFHALESHATAPPRARSILTNPQAKLSGRRRFKPVE